MWVTTMLSTTVVPLSYPIYCDRSFHIYVYVSSLFSCPLPRLPRRIRRTHIHRLSHEVQHLEASLRGVHAPALVSEQPEFNSGRRLPANGVSHLKGGAGQAGLLVEVCPMFNGVRKWTCSRVRAHLPFPCTSSLLYRLEHNIYNPSCEKLFHEMSALQFQQPVAHVYD